MYTLYCCDVIYNNYFFITESNSNGKLYIAKNNMRSDENGIVTNL